MASRVIQLNSILKGNDDLRKTLRSTDLMIQVDEQRILPATEVIAENGKIRGDFSIKRSPNIKINDGITVINPISEKPLGVKSLNIVEDSLFNYKCIAHTVSKDLRMSAGIAAAISMKCPHPDLRKQSAKIEVGSVIIQKSDTTTIFHLVTKELYYSKPTEATLKKACVTLGHVLTRAQIESIAIPWMGAGLDGLDKKVCFDVYRSTLGVEVNLCSPWMHLRVREENGNLVPSIFSLDSFSLIKNANCDNCLTEYDRVTKKILKFTENQFTAMNGHYLPKSDGWYVNQFQGLCVTCADIQNTTQKSLYLVNAKQSGMTPILNSDRLGQEVKLGRADVMFLQLGEALVINVASFHNTTNSIVDNNLHHLITSYGMHSYLPISVTQTIYEAHLRRHPLLLKTIEFMSGSVAVHDDEVPMVKSSNVIGRLECFKASSRNDALTLINAMTCSTATDQILLKHTTYASAGYILKQIERDPKTILYLSFKNKSEVQAYGIIHTVNELSGDERCRLIKNVMSWYNLAFSQMHWFDGLENQFSSIFYDEPNDQIGFIFAQS